MHQIMTVVVCWMLVCAWQPSMAQETKPKPAASDTLVVTRPEVVVTAIRGEEDIREVPLAITIVPPMVLETQRGYGIDGMLTLVPGVIGQSRTGGVDSRVQIRGFGARGAGQRSNAGTSRGIRFYTDGIPETEPDGRTSFDLINSVHASKVEVVRSNASTLWGNAAGGVVNVSTVPLTRDAFAQLDASFGSFGFMRQSLLANTPMGDGQAYVSITNTSMDGWREQSRGFQTLGTIGLVTKPSDRTNVNVFITGASNQFEIPGPITRDQYNADPQQAQADTTIYKPSFVQRDERRDNRLARIGSTFDHSFSDHQSIAGSAFVQSKKLERSERNTWRDFNRYHIGGSMLYRNSQELSAAVNRIMVGGDAQYQDGAILFYNLNTDAGRGTTLRQNKREGALNMGAFLQDEFMISDLSIVAGLRYDAVRYIDQDFINPASDTMATYSRLIPKVGIAYRVSPMFNPYANLGGGFEVPAGNETDPPAVIGSTTPSKSLNPLLKPISSTTYEVGVKGATEERSEMWASLQYDVALWYISVLNDIVPYNSGAFFVPAAESKRMGAELGVTAITNFGVTVAGALTVMRTEYSDYVVDSGYISQNLSGKTADYSGNEQPGIPSLSATLRVRYDADVLGGLYAEAESRTLNGYVVDDANTMRTDGWTTVALAVGLRIPIVHNTLIADVRGRVDNVLNTTYMASAWVNPDVTRGGAPFIESGLPRNAMVTVGLRYAP